MQSAAGELTITTRGRRYGIARDADGFALVDLALPGPPVIDHFPPGRDGWNLAWRRLTALDAAAAAPPALALSGPGEAPGGALREEGSPRVGRSSTRSPRADLDAVGYAGAAVAVVGVALGAIGLFPAYLGGASLASQPDGLWPHVVVLATWAASAVLLLGGGRVARIGAALGTGAGAVTLGLLVADLGSAPGQPAGATGPGIYLSLAAWLACSAAFTVALVSHERAARAAASAGPSRRAPRRVGGLAMLGVAVAIGAAVLFAPPWDSYSIASAATGAHQTVTAGNVFANPGLAIAGDLLAMVAVVAVALYAYLGSRDLGAVGSGLLAGSTLVLFSQIVSALAQSAPSPAAFGIGAAAAASAQVTVGAGFTSWFYLYCACVAAGAVLTLGVATARRAPRDPSRSLQAGAPA
ncbi:MAG: hypothetical protein M0Z33_09490 [Actinomycetota bacterium]|nr:hypothetical protein [Actinomycetota bacterium]